MKTDSYSDFAPTAVQGTDEAQPTSSQPGFLSSWLDRLGLGADPAWRDTTTHLNSRAGLLERGEQLLARRSGRQGPSLVLFHFGDLLEARGIYGMRVHDRALEVVVAGVQRLAGRRGLAARSGPVQFAVLLPGTARPDAIEAAHAAFGRPCRVELMVGREELVLVPDVVVDTCAVHVSLEELYTRLATTLALHRQQQMKPSKRVSTRRGGEREGAALRRSTDAPASVTQ